MKVKKKNKKVVYVNKQKWKKHFSLHFIPDN